MTLNTMQTGRTAHAVCEIFLLYNTSPGIAPLKRYLSRFRNWKNKGGR